MKKPKKLDRSAVMKKAWATRRGKALELAMPPEWRVMEEGRVSDGLTIDGGTMETVENKKVGQILEAAFRARDYQQIKEFMEAIDVMLHDNPDMNFFRISRSTSEALKRVFGDKL